VKLPRTNTLLTPSPSKRFNAEDLKALPRARASVSATKAMNTPTIAPMVLPFLSLKEPQASLASTSMRPVAAHLKFFAHNEDTTLRAQIW